MEIKYFKKVAAQKTFYNNTVYPMEQYIPKGCAEDEIAALEDKMGVRFPQAYKEYLFLMGEEHKLYWSGVEYSFSQLEELQELAFAVLEEEGYSLEHPHWVINTLDEQFHFFYLKDGDNPPVYHWLGSDESMAEGYANGMILVNKQFSTFIKEMFPSKLERALEWFSKKADDLRSMFKQSPRKGK